MNDFTMVIYPVHNLKLKKKTFKILMNLDTFYVTKEFQDWLKIKEFLVSFFLVCLFNIISTFVADLTPTFTYRRTVVVQFNP